MSMVEKFSSGAIVSYEFESRNDDDIIVVWNMISSFVVIEFLKSPAVVSYVTFLLFSSSSLQLFSPTTLAGALR